MKYTIDDFKTIKQNFSNKLLNTQFSGEWGNRGFQALFAQWWFTSRSVSCCVVNWFENILWSLVLLVLVVLVKDQFKLMVDNVKSSDFFTIFPNFPQNPGIKNYSDIKISLIWLIIIYWEILSQSKSSTKM